MRDLDALEALLAAATPGPWREESGMNVKRDEDAPHPAHVATCMGSDHKESDARAIVALRNVAPEMLAVLRAAERVRGAPMLDSIRELGRALDALRAKLREVTG